MATDLKVTILADNRAREGLSAEDGLSLWVQADGASMLFDAGRGGALLSNAQALGVPVGEADAVVLSHGHGDHTGGLSTLALDSTRARIYLHPAALVPRYSRSECLPQRSIGMPAASVAAVQHMAERITWTTAPIQVRKGVGVTGPIPRTTRFEDVGGPFFLDADCTQPDGILDDQAVWMETTRGVVLLLGCAHAGVVNTLDYVAALLGAPHFHAVIGGMHLRNASRERLRKTAEAFADYGVTIVAPCHCTGDAAANYLKDRLPENVVSLPVGASLEF